MHENLSSKNYGSFPAFDETRRLIPVFKRHSDPHEPNPPPHFGNHDLTNYTFCFQQVLYGIAEPSTFQDPIEEPKIILCKTLPTRLALPFVKNGSFQSRKEKDALKLLR